MYCEMRLDRQLGHAVTLLLLLQHAHTSKTLLILICKLENTQDEAICFEVGCWEK